MTTGNKDSRPLDGSIHTRSPIYRAIPTPTCVEVSDHEEFRLLRGDAVNVERHDLALFAGELHADQMNRLAGGAVLVGIALGLDLLQRFALGQLLHNLELEQIEVAAEIDGHIHAAVVAGVLDSDGKAKRGKVAVEDAGIVALVAGNGVVAVPVVGQAGKERLEVGLQARQVVSLQDIQQSQLMRLGLAVADAQHGEQQVVQAAFYFQVRKAQRV